MSSSSHRYQLIVSAAAMVVIIAGLKFADGFVVPVLLGVTVAAVSSPLVSWLLRRGAPPILGAALVLLLDIGVLGGLATLMTLAASDLQQSLPKYASRLSAMTGSVDRYFHHRGLSIDTSSIIQADQMIGGMAGRFASFASYLAVVLFVVFFALCELSVMGDKLRALTHNADAQFARVDRIVREVQLYLVVKTGTSLLAGVCAFCVLRIFHVDLALLLALSMFILHFVPNIGAAVATLPAVVIALADRGPGTALGVGVTYLTVNTLIGNLLEPRLLGRTLGMSPVVVLVGMLFWGWLWGPVGALLSVPLMVVTKIVLENIPDLAWIAQLAEHAPRTLRTSRTTLADTMLRKPDFVIGLGAKPDKDARDSRTPSLGTHKL